MKALTHHSTAARQVGKLLHERSRRLERDVFHHVSLGSNDLHRAKTFYDPIMAQLGYRMVKQSDRIVAYGLTTVLFSLEMPVDGQCAACGNGGHIAFEA